MNTYRHGDISLIQVESIPETAKRSESKIILQEGSGGHPHGVDQGEVYFVTGEENVIGYLKANGTKLLHPEHGETLRGDGNKEAFIDDGIYRIERQVEEGHEGMRQVID